MQGDQACSEPWHSHNSLFKHFQGYLDIFRETDTYSATLTGAKLGERERSALYFFENQKKCPDLGKKDLDCVYLWVKFSI